MFRKGGRNVEREDDKSFAKQTVLNVRPYIPEAFNEFGSPMYVDMEKKLGVIVYQFT